MARDTSFVDDVRIASPCHASWEAMDGGERVRFCSDCERSVYNLSGMSREEAAALIAEHEGRLCVRLYRRSDGTILTQNCPAGVRAERFAAIRKTAAAASFVAFLANAALHPPTWNFDDSQTTRPNAAIELADLQTDNLDLPGTLRTASSFDFQEGDPTDNSLQYRNIFGFPTPDAETQLAPHARYRVTGAIMPEHVYPRTKRKED